MNKQVLLALSLLVVGVASSSLGSQSINGFGDHHHEHHIDWCANDNDDECYCNKITLQGPKAKLVNLDDHCQLDDIEDEGGIFLLTGDILVVTGRANSSSLQDWGVFCYDTSILGIGNEINL